MPYSEEELDAMQYDPVVMRAYFWRVAMGAKRRSLVTKREIIERGRYSVVPHFRGVYEEDVRKRDWADVEERLSKVVLDNIDALVRSCTRRPKVCETCRRAAKT